MLIEMQQSIDVHLIFIFFKLFSKIIIYIRYTFFSKISIYTCYIFFLIVFIYIFYILCSKIFYLFITKNNCSITHFVHYFLSLIFTTPYIFIHIKNAIFIYSTTVLFFYISQKIYLLIESLFIFKYNQLLKYP